MWLCAPASDHAIKFVIAPEMHSVTCELKYRPHMLQAFIVPSAVRYRHSPTPGWRIHLPTSFRGQTPIMFDSKFRLQECVRVHGIVDVGFSTCICSSFVMHCWRLPSAPLLTSHHVGSGSGTRSNSSSRHLITNALYIHVYPPLRMCWYLLFDGMLGKHQAPPHLVMW
jgi:hypothetical protein